MFGTSEPASPARAVGGSDSNGEVEPANAEAGSPGMPKANPAKKAQWITAGQVLRGRPPLCTPVMFDWVEQIYPGRKHKFFDGFSISVLLQANFAAYGVIFRFPSVWTLLKEDQSRIHASAPETSAKTTDDTWELLERGEAAHSRPASPIAPESLLFQHFPGAARRWRYRRPIL